MVFREICTSILVLLFINFATCNVLWASWAKWFLDLLVKLFLFLPTDLTIYFTPS